METITLELAVAEGDPYDRTLSFMIRSGPDLIVARSIRILDEVRIGQVLYHIERAVLKWAQPEINELEGIHEFFDRMERLIGSPF